MMEIPNHVHRLRALVEYSMEDEVRAKVLLSVVREINTYLYQDLVELGPQGKTERKLTQFKLTNAAERMIGSALPRLPRLGNVARSAAPDLQVGWVM
ncbi:golgin subfamily B member 1 [Sarotherodon galilaeus]